MATWEFALYAGLLTAFIVVIWLLTAYKRLWVHYNSVAVVVRGSKVVVLQPGKHWLKPGSVTHVVWMWERNVYLPTQEIPTSEGVAARYNLFATYAVTDPKKFAVETEDAQGVIYRELQAAMRDCISMKSLEEARMQTVDVGAVILESVKEKLERYGLEITSARILDIQLPNDMKRAVAGAELERRLANQNLEKARAEIATLRALSNAAKMLEENPRLLDLRRMQAIEQALNANKGNVTIEWRGPSDVPKSG